MAPQGKGKQMMSPKDIEPTHAFSAFSSLLSLRDFLSIC
jgi:hypothetical protein